MTYSSTVFTVAETPEFSTIWPKYWTEEEFGDFCAYLAQHPEAGDVIKGTGGCRKIRWSVSGRGKRGGVRVIYFNRLDAQKLWLLTMYAKNVRADVETKIVKALRRSIDG
jgi:hypothetical protein